MSHRRTIIVLGVIISMSALSIFYSCKKGNDTAAISEALSALDLPATPYNYASQSLPFYLGAPLITGQDNTPANNQVTDWGATLGRVLFYDKTLSINGTVACTSCHKQEFSFADNKTFSTGFAGASTARNSMSLVNAKYYPDGRFFWDERAATLEIQTLTPIQDHNEMGMNLDTLVRRLGTKIYYPVLFQKAFGDASVTSDRVSKALSQFVRSIISYQSKFDAGRAQVQPGQDPVITPYSNFTPQENMGKQLFFSQQAACATCHGTETFTAPGDRNNGIENPSVDKGVGGISGIAGQVGNFKVPSLKNIELTAPYMHDGRFTTLEQVVEHYSSGISDNPNLAPQLKTPGGIPRQLNLTTDQKAALVAFLKTLTDRSITTDQKFGNPFK